MLPVDARLLLRRASEVLEAVRRHWVSNAAAGILALRLLLVVKFGLALGLLRRRRAAAVEQKRLLSVLAVDLSLGKEESQPSSVVLERHGGKRLAANARHATAAGHRQPLLSASQDGNDDTNGERRKAVKKLSDATVSLFVTGAGVARMPAHRASNKVGKGASIQHRMHHLPQHSSREKEGLGRLGRSRMKRRMLVGCFEDWERLVRPGRGGAVTLVALTTAMNHRRESASEARRKGAGK